MFTVRPDVPEENQMLMWKYEEIKQEDFFKCMHLIKLTGFLFCISLFPN